MIAPAEASPSPCIRLNTWLDAEDRAVSPAYSLKDRSRWSDHAQIEKHRIASGLFTDLLEGKLPVGALDNCIARRPDRQNLLNFIQSQFLQKGVERLGLSQSEPIQKFLMLVKERYGTADRIFFRMTGHFKEEAPAEFKAGYHRASRSIYMDWNRVPANEWLVILSHELLHSLDPQIWDGLEFAGAPAHVRRVQKLVKNFAQLDELNPEDQAFLERWVRAGLERGLWAEYRAWLATLSIYEAGVKDSLWAPISWLDKIVSQCPAGVSRARCFYEYIDPRSPDPAEGLLGSPLVSSMIRQVRAKQRLWNVPLELGPLSPIVVLH